MKILKYTTVLIVVMLVSFAPVLSAGETGIIYDTFDDDAQLKESCSMGPGYSYSSWSGAKVDNIGYHPETKN